MQVLYQGNFVAQIPDLPPNEDAIKVMQFYEATK